ncbi:MAG: hypothetical protein KKE62_16210 [Proteobacteria bacterium]|nr:hypothetical protein [Pseudomonadota bacterium]MBU1386726.1 hypothetical protein [Pseudomonadota bacterium]MBU1544374.1 hypothetical protein [Pseudomonadota bacterium]MBU2481752.1 hypothetical protein [Pseudomonadota bacterium]
MIHKIIIPLFHEEVAPRFDLASEVLVILLSKGNVIEEKKTIVLPRPSADELCHLLLSENVNTLICGAIEEEYYQFLKWKKINIYDSIAGNWALALEHWQKNVLKCKDILLTKMAEGKYV